MRTTETITAPGRAPRTARSAGDRELARFADRMGLPADRRLRLERAVRWLLVASSIGLVVLGVNP